MFAFSVVDVDPVVSDYPAFRPFHEFECLSCFACAGRGYYDDSLAPDIDACAVYRVGVLRLFENCGRHSVRPALALAIILSVEEYGLVSLGAVERRSLMASDADCRNDSCMYMRSLGCLMPLECPVFVLVLTVALELK